MRAVFTSHRGQRRAFTLIELLVVVAIIALLVSILLPSLQKAREAAKRSACLSSMKNIASTSRVYEAGDPSGWGIPVHPGQYTQDSQDPTFIGAYEWGGKSGIGFPEFLGGTDPLNSKYGTRAGFGPSTRPMNVLLYPAGFPDWRFPDENEEGLKSDTTLKMDLFICPGDKNPPRAGHCPDWLANSERSSYDHFGNSYVANVFMTAPSTGGEMESNSPYMRPVTRVPTPARTLYYEENIGRWAWAAREDPCDFLRGINIDPLKSIGGWHGKDWHYVRSFVDAHAEYQKIIEEGTEDINGYSKHYRIETIYMDRGQQDQFRCIIVRGVGWAKDTLPSPRVRTGLNHSGRGRPSYEGCVQE